MDKSDPNLRGASDVTCTMAYALKKANLPHIRVHDLRHTVGSLLLDAGYSLAMVADLLGHSSPATLAAVYAHVVRKGVNLADALNKEEVLSDKSPEAQ